MSSSSLEAPPHRPATLAGLLASAALVAAVVSSAQVHHNWTSAGVTISYLEIFGAKLLEWSLWAAAVLGIVWLDGRHGFRRRSWPTAAMVHLAAAIGWFLVINAILTFLSRMADPLAGDTTYGALFANRLFFKLPAALGVYAFILAAYGVAHLFSERYRQSAREAQLESELNSARLQNLQRQLQPHFLFNTLHSIGGMVREGEAERAVDMIAELSELLRRALSSDDRHEVTLDEELEFLDHYVRIQQVRFADRLVARYAIDPSARQVLIPSLLLQPLVENAVRHGLERTGQPVEIRISAHLEDGRLVLEVADTGPGLPSSPIIEGVGIGATRKRLSHLYADEQSLDLMPRTGGGTRVRVTVPNRTKLLSREDA